MNGRVSRLGLDLFAGIQRTFEAAHEMIEELAEILAPLLLALGWSLVP